MIYVWDEEAGTVVPKGSRPPKGPGKPYNDEQPPTQSMADGKVYTSKAAMRRSYLASGNPQGIHYTEVGNDPGRFRDRPQPQADRQGIRDAIGKAQARFNRGERH